MATGRRIKRLRDVIDQIERLPASPDRDRLLSEVRSRAVDVDTGVTPRALLPMREPAPSPVLHRAPQGDRAAIVTGTAFSPTVPPPVELACPASAASGSNDLDEPFWVDGRLSLEDSLPIAPLPHVRARGGRFIAPWTLGLRG